MSACDATWAESVSAWFDGEVDAAERARVEVHLRACAPCAAFAQQLAMLRQELGAAPREATVPPQLQAAVERLVEPPPRRARPASALRSVGRRVAAAVAGLALVSGVLWSGWPGGFSAALAADLEGHHLRAFSRARPCDFESADAAAVQAWAEAQLGHAVHVPQVPGATLLGARRCRLHGRLAVALLYRYGNHALTVFVPTDGSEAEAEGASLAKAGPHCDAGPLGERICVARRGDDVRFAVSEVGDTLLLGALDAR